MNFKSDRERKFLFAKLSPHGTSFTGSIPMAQNPNVPKGPQHQTKGTGAIANRRSIWELLGQKSLKGNPFKGGF